VDGIFGVGEGCDDFSELGRVWVGGTVVAYSEDRMVVREVSERFFTNARPRVLLAPVNTMVPIDMVASDVNGVFIGWSKAFSPLHINKRSRCGRF
jgi:hypothetical protein